MATIKQRLEKLEAAKAATGVGDKDLLAQLLRLYGRNGDDIIATVAAYEQETGRQLRTSQSFLQRVERIGKQLTAFLAEAEAVTGHPMVNHGSGLITPAPMTEAAWEAAAETKFGIKTGYKRKGGRVVECT